MDELLPETGHLASVHAFRDKSVSTIFHENNDVNDALSQQMQSMSLGTPSMLGFERIDHDVAMETNNSEEPRMHPENPEAPRMHTENPEADFSEMQQSLYSIVDRPCDSRQENKDISLDELIKSCLHGAAAMLEEESAQSQRKTERVRMVMKLFEQKAGMWRNLFK